MSDELKTGVARVFGDEAEPTPEAVPAESGEESTAGLASMAGPGRSRFDVSDATYAPAGCEAPDDEEDVEEDEEIYGGEDDGDIEEGSTSEVAVTGTSFAILGGLSDSFSAVLPASWNPSMGVRPYIGITNMLLQYLADMEKRYSMTMPIRACGVDRVIFEHADYVKSDESDSDRFFLVSPAHNDAETGGTTDEENNRLYELVEIDGELYMSCITHFLNRDYFEQIIMNATCAIKEHGVYVFPLVGLRSLSDDPEDGLLNTMRLNSYELNALIQYMDQFPHIKITSLVNDDGHECLHFAIEE